MNGETVERVRRAMGMTLVTFGLVMGVEPATVYRWEAEYYRRISSRRGHPLAKDKLPLLLENLNKLTDEELASLGRKVEDLLYRGRDAAREVIDRLT